MTIQPGDVFGFWNSELNAYVACQITHIVPPRFLIRTKSAVRDGEPYHK
ncbi:hypothetical protein [Paenibacillus marinisediminis]